MESAHGTDVVAPIGAAFTSRNDSVYGDGLKGEGHRAAMEATERYDPVAKGG